MSNKERKIMLYYSKSCPYSTKFLPIFKGIKKRIDNIKKTNNLVSYEEYEETENPIAMEFANIVAYPTIRIKIGDNVIDYKGTRTADAIMNTLMETNESNLSIGSSILIVYLMALQNI